MVIDISYPINASDWKVHFTVGTNKYLPDIEALGLDV